MLCRSTQRLRRSIRYRVGDRVLPPKTSPEPSKPDFWAFFERLPRAERDTLNYAINGPDYAFKYQNIVRVYWPQLKAEVLAAVGGAR
jgi:hypothetical protein